MVTNEEQFWNEKPDIRYGIRISDIGEITSLTRRRSHVHVIRFFISFCKIAPDGKNDEKESLMMGDFDTYLIELCGMMSEADINVMSTLRMKAVTSEAGYSRFSVCTDQSGLIGMLRQIHARGIKLNSVVKTTNQTTNSR